MQQKSTLKDFTMYWKFPGRIKDALIRDSTVQLYFGTYDNKDNISVMRYSPIYIQVRGKNEGGVISKNFKGENTGM